MTTVLHPMHRNPTDYGKISEESILSDIAYFEERLAKIGTPFDTYGRARKHVYSVLLRHRRQLLAAFRDGRPEAWPDYEDQVTTLRGVVKPR